MASVDRFVDDLVVVHDDQHAARGRAKRIVDHHQWLRRSRRRRSRLVFGHRNIRKLGRQWR
jgi:hypothetical protein